MKVTFSQMPPSVNAMYLNRPGKGRIKTPAYRKWRAATDWEIAAQRPKKVEGPYELHIRIQREWRSKHARDIDNFIKAASDCFVRLGLVEDDSLAECVSARWDDNIEGCEVEINATQPVIDDWYFQNEEAGLEPSEK